MAYALAQHLGEMMVYVLAPHDGEIYENFEVSCTLLLKPQIWNLTLHIGCILKFSGGELSLANYT